MSEAHVSRATAQALTRRPEAQVARVGAQALVREIVYGAEVSRVGAQTLVRWSTPPAAEVSRVGAQVLARERTWADQHPLRVPHDGEWVHPLPIVVDSLGGEWPLRVQASGRLGVGAGEARRWFAFLDELPDNGNGADLSDADPQPLADAAAPGTDSEASRSDHEHPVPDLDDLADVDAESPSDGDALVWNEGESQWEPGEVGNGNGVDDDGNVLGGTANDSTAVAAGDSTADEEGAVTAGEGAWAGNTGAGSTHGQVAIGWGSTADGQAAIAIGNGATADGTNYAVAIGYQAFADNGGTSLGRESHADPLSVAIGRSASATDREAVAIGEDAQSEDESVAIGHEADAVPSTGSRSQCVAIGPEAVSNRHRTIAVGYDAEASADGALAVGRQTVASGSSAVALGRESSSDHSASTALGRDTVTSADDQTHIGERHLALDESDEPGTPPSGEARIWLEDDDGAKTLKVKFDNGHVATIADDGSS